MVVGTLTPEELSKFLRQEDDCAPPPRLLPIWLWILSLPGWALALISLAAHGAEAFGREVFWLGVLLCLPMALEKIYRRIVTSSGAARDRIGASRRLSSKTVYRFFPDRMEAETRTADEVTPWRDVQSVVELDVGFIVRAKGKDAVYVPKRCFRSDLDLEAFREILRGVVGKRFQWCRAPS